MLKDIDDWFCPLRKPHYHIDLAEQVVTSPNATPKDMTQICVAAVFVIDGFPVFGTRIALRTGERPDCGGVVFAEVLG